jgi:MbtH protein
MERLFALMWLKEWPMQAVNEERYFVVVNDEQQYSIWPSGRDIPQGWRKDGFEGSKAQCLTHIADVWADMRPLSVRRHLQTVSGTSPIPTS